MTSSGFPEQRAVPARILTPRGWIQGTFHPPKTAHILDYLNRAGPYVNITEVTSGPSEHVLPYLSIQRAAISLVLPDEPVPLVAGAMTNRHRVYCLLAEGSVMATLDVRTQVRVSDYFMNRTGFVPLRDVQLRVLPELPGGELPDAVLLNAERTLGVAELANQ